MPVDDPLRKHRVIYVVVDRHSVDNVRHAEFRYTESVLLHDLRVGIALHDIAVHRIVTAILQKRDQLVGPDPLDRLAEQASADSAGPRTEDFPFKRGLVGRRERRSTAAQSPYPIEIGRLGVRVALRSFRVEDDIENNVGDPRFGIVPRQKRDRAEKLPVFLQVKPLIYALLVLDGKVGAVYLPLGHFFVFRADLSSEINVVGEAFVPAEDQRIKRNPEMLCDPDQLVELRNTRPALPFLNGLPRDPEHLGKALLRHISVRA